MMNLITIICILLLSSAFAHVRDGVSLNHTLLSDALISSTAANAGHRLLNINRQRYWKERESGRAVIPYFISDSFGDSDRQLIQESLNDLGYKTGNFLKFIERTTHNRFIHVVRETDSCHFLYADGGGPQTVNLATGCMVKGIIQHEFIHALGFVHEQSRPDRESYVEIIWENIEDRRELESQFSVDPSAELMGSPYDYNSVMHYGPTAFGIDGATTIVPKAEGVSIGQRDGPSEDDIRKLQLFYQCENGISRDWNSMINYPCTPECMCREGETGCGDNNDACHDSLVCVNDQCVADTADRSYCGCSSCTQDVWDSGATNWSGTYSCGARITFLQSEGQSEEEACSTVASEFPDICTCSCNGATETAFLIQQNYPYNDNDLRCMDVKYSDTTNGNDVWYFHCNYSPAQYWYYDGATNYYRSYIDNSKCLVGSSGSTDLGTRLIINDCFSSDERFVWDWYSDGSIRPRNNDQVCIVPSNEGETITTEEGEIKGLYLILGYCGGNFSSFDFVALNHSGRNLQSDTRITSSVVGNDIDRPPRSGSINCQDSPMGWYDLLGRNCAWYGEDTSNCDVYGYRFKNFGRTASSACCVCGGGPSTEHASLDYDAMNAAQVENINGCWDQPDWYDSTGEGCGWYSKENMCAYFGNQFERNGQTANNACCVCGGGLATAPSALSEDVLPGCSDSPFSWADDMGLTCEWYAQDFQNCLEFGDKVGYFGKTANEVCCACNGGYDPNASPMATTENSTIMEVQREPSSLTNPDTINMADSKVNMNGSMSTAASIANLILPSSSLLVLAAAAVIQQWWY